MNKILCFIALSALSASSLATPIASFDALSEVGFTISDSSLDVTVSSLITESTLDEFGSSTGSVGSSGDLPATSPDASFVWAATASGIVDPVAGNVSALSEIEGGLFITNTTEDHIDFTIDFGIVLTAGALTTDPLDETLAVAGVFIEDKMGTIFEDFLTMGSFLGDSGSLTTDLSTSASYSLESGESLDIFLGLGAGGSASVERIIATEEVPVPATFWLFAASLAGLGANSRKKLSQVNVTPATES